MSDSESSGSGSSGSDREQEETPQEEKKEKKEKKDKKKHKKHKSKDKKKDKKKRKHDSDDEDREKKRRKEEKKLVKKAKEFLKKQEEEEAELPPNVPYRISAEHDYYKHLSDFKVYCKLIKHISFETLSRDEAQKAFEGFVKDWNRGKLPEMYYTGIPSHLLQECNKTEHRWGFTKNLTEKDKFLLENTSDRVVSATSKNPLGGTMPPPSASSRGGKGAAGGGGGRDWQQAQLEKEQRMEGEKSKRKALRDKDKVVMEELAPKATGREAKIENRRAKADTIHGAARAAEDARDGLALDESVTMGGGDDFASMRQRLKSREERKVSDRERMLLEHQQKEQASMAKLLSDLGIKPGDRITIQKRTS